MLMDSNKRKEPPPHNKSSSAKKTKVHNPTVEEINEVTGLQLALYRQWLSPDEKEFWWNSIMEKMKWYRVKYKSRRFQKKLLCNCHPSNSLQQWLHALLTIVRGLFICI